MSLQDFLPTPTDWRLVNSAGGEISLGLGEFLSVGASIGDLYVRENDGLLINLRSVGLKGGVGVGLSILGPISASFSPASFAGEGIGRIYKGHSAGSRLSINDMLGHFYMVTFGLNALPAGFTVSVVFFGLPVPAIGSVGRTFLLFAKAAGLVWGVAAGTSGGLEGSSCTGRILAAYANGVEVAGD